MTWPEIRDEIEKQVPVKWTTNDLASLYGLRYKQMKNLLDHYGFLPGIDYKLDKPGPKGPRK